MHRSSLARPRKPLERRSLLKRGGPIKVRRRSVPAAEKRHIARVAGLPCLVSGEPATVHHVTGYADRAGRITRSDRRVVPLAPRFHLIQWGPKTSVEALGHRGFFITYGIDLLSEADRLWRETNA
jgi:hypothetical protein